MEKHYRLIDLRLYPPGDGESGPFPASMAFAYSTEVVEDGSVIASSGPHRGSAPLTNFDHPVAISSDGVTKTVGDILSEVGLPAITGAVQRS